MNNYQKFASLALLITAAFPSQAEKKFAYNETVWASLGAGVRSSFRAQEDRSVDDWDTRANLDNFRVYLNAQVHKYFKIEVNSDCSSCGNGGDLQLLDAIGKFEVHPLANVWVGRHLVPAERRELNGPFYSAVYNIFQSGTPGAIQVVSSIISGIATASIEQNAGIDQVHEAVVQMDGVTQQNAALVEEAAAAAESLSEQTRNLAQEMAHFRT